MTSVAKIGTRQWWPTVLLGILLGVLGCSSEEVTKALDSAKQAATDFSQQASEAAADVLPATGSVSLNGTESLQCEMAEVRLFVVGSGRPSSVQVWTYDPDASDRDRMNQTAICIHGPTSVTTIEALVGQSVACQMYVEQRPGLPILMTPPGQSVNLRFGSFNSDDNTITSTLEPVKLISSDGSSFEIGGGEIIAAVRKTN